MNCVNGVTKTVKMENNNARGDIASKTKLRPSLYRFTKHLIHFMFNEIFGFYLSI